MKELGLGLAKVGHRLQKSHIDYKELWSGLAKVGHRLQSLMMDYKRPEKLDIDYKV